MLSLQSTVCERKEDQYVCIYNFDHLTISVFLSTVHFDASAQLVEIE